MLSRTAGTRPRHLLKQLAPKQGARGSVHGVCFSHLSQGEPVTANAWLIRLFAGTGLLAILSLGAPVTSADCARDLRGEVFCGAGRCVIDSDGTVWCSRHYKGDAQITLDGRVLCGKGQCAKDPHGQVFCSSVVGGAVLMDSRGHVRCYGQCEPATADECENTRADSAGG